MITIELKNNRIIIADNVYRYLIKPPIFSLKSLRNLRKRSVVIGLIGPRGSGKSVGGARLAILDFMLAGVTNVWSNMDIGFILSKNGNQKMFHSKPIEKLSIIELDRLYNDGLIFEDEVNMDVADSRRAMSKETLAFDYVVQQLRKRRLNIIWTAQSEYHVESRLRSQTDIFIKCTDVSLTNSKCGIGELSRYRCYDYAGLINEQIPDEHFNGVFKETTVWNKPWWNSYSTWQLQGIEEAKQEQETTNKYESTIKEIEEYIRECDEPIKQETIWARWSIRERDTKKQIRELLNSRGILTTDLGRKFVTEEYIKETT